MAAGTSRVRHALIFVFCTPFLIGTTVADDGKDRSAKYDLDIPAQELNAALQSVALASNHELLYRSELAEGKKSRALKGKYTAHEALQALLSDTELTFKITPAAVVLIRDKSANGNNTLEQNDAPPSVSQPANSERQIRLAQADEDLTEEEQSISSDNGAKQLEEFVVTGTNIRGIGLESIASPVFSYSQEDIQRSGVGSVAEFIQTIPQNFSGGVNENNAAQTIPGGGANEESFQSFNLRGLGSDATLTLLNGRRIANGGLTQVPTISILPASLVERIDVVADGSSSVYGADAVGGVVNIITRRDFDGAEVRARGGSATSGSFEDYQLGATIGNSWSSGNAFMDVSWSDRNPMMSNERGYTTPGTSGAPFHLTPEIEMTNLFVGVGQQLGAVDLTLDGLYFDRKNNYASPDGGGADTKADGYVLYGNAGWTIGDRTSIDFYVDYSDIVTSSEFIVAQTSQELTNELFVGEGVLRTELFALPAGPIRFAGGAQFRDESAMVVTPQGDRMEQGREISSVFAEFFVPLVGPDRQVPLMRSLDLIASGRYEDFSDVGSSTVPKVGLSWSVNETLTLRGTYSESFVVPSLRTLSGPTVAPFRVQLDPGLDPADQNPLLPEGFSLIASLAGANRNLVAQDAETFTLGFDLTPPAMEGLRIGGNYYSVEFSNRITGINFEQVLTVPGFEGLITRPPDIAQMASWFTDPDIFLVLNFTGLGGPVVVTDPSQLPFDLEDVEVFYDARSQNFAVEKTDGIDLYADYRFESGRDTWSFGFNGQYILELANKISPADPFVPRDGTVFNPPNLALQGTLGWSRGPYSIFTMLNHIDSTDDNREGFGGEIGGFTTVDISFGWDSANRSGGGAGTTSVMLTVRNAFDEDPSPVAGVEFGYDPYQANPLGRVLALSLVKQW